MEPNSVEKRLAAANEAIAMGDKDLNERPVFKTMGLKKLAAAAVLVGALAVGALSAESDTGFLNTAQEQGTAQVVAKIWNPGGALLSKGYFQLGDNQVWQPVQDSEGSAHKLVLSLPNELQPVTVSVSPEIYENYCKKAEFFERSANNISPELAGCGAIHRAGELAPAHIPLDNLQVSFTRSKIDGSIQITEINEQPKFATGFVERYQLRKMFQDQQELSQSLAAKSTNRPG